ncbi:class I SAM-dependent methyltransferase, partial [bacterium]|nr:class I SAM-dependent methyltransferase [bacterium]
FMKPYKFTEDWFSGNIPVWERVLARFEGKPVAGIEIGCYEGRATCWLLENILTNPNSSITCVDTFKGSPEHELMETQLEGMRDRFQHNIKLRPVESGRVYIIPEESAYALRRLRKENQFDFAYIDGSHHAADVFQDIALLWPLMKLGSIIIFDDYLWCLEREFDPAFYCDLPRPAIDAFLRCFSDQVEVLERGYQIMVSKKEKTRGNPIAFL